MYSVCIVPVLVRKHCRELTFSLEHTIREQLGHYLWVQTQASSRGKNWRQGNCTRAAHVMLDVQKNCSTPHAVFAEMPLMPLSFPTVAGAESRPSAQT